MEYSSNAYQPPDLASVLRTLSALAPAQGQGQAPAHQQPFPSQSQARPEDDELEEGEYDPADDYDPSQTLPPPSQPHHQPQPPSPLPTSSSHALPPTPAPLQPPANPNSTEQAYPHHQPLPPPKPSAPKTSPSTITTYPPALRHILHLTSTTPTFLPSIQKLLTTQHRHEREWHAQRLALQSRLANRAESRSKLDDVLSALGGKVSGGGKGEEDAGEEEKREKEAEMERFDRKVWKAQVEMVRAIGRDLAALGVPGFGEGFRGSEEEGRVLRGRVLGLLEDLCGGEEEGVGR